MRTLIGKNFNSLHEKPFTRRRSRGCVSFLLKELDTSRGSTVIILTRSLTINLQMSNNVAKSPKNVSFYNVIKCEMKLLKSENFDEFTFLEVCDFLLDYLGL